MGDEADRIINDIIDGGYRDDGRDEPEYITCKRCGKATLRWLRSAHRWTLYEPSGELHSCRPDPATMFDPVDNTHEVVITSQNQPRRTTMSEHQETVHVVMREAVTVTPGRLKAAKVFDDRADARAYAKLMNGRSKKYRYTVQSCKKG